jgi:hypothetical protein
MDPRLRGDDIASMRQDCSRSNGSAEKDMRGGRRRIIHAKQRIAPLPTGQASPSRFHSERPFPIQRFSRKNHT